MQACSQFSWTRTAREGHSPGQQQSCARHTNVLLLQTFGSVEESTLASTVWASHFLGQSRGYLVFRGGTNAYVRTFKFPPHSSRSHSLALSLFLSCSHSLSLAARQQQFSIRPPPLAPRRRCATEMHLQQWRRCVQNNNFTPATRSRGVLAAIGTPCKV